MAYLVQVEYYDDFKEIVPIWSSALPQELTILERDNDIENIILISEDATKEECNYWYGKLDRTIYVLPTEYKENRIIIKENENE